MYKGLTRDLAMRLKSHNSGKVKSTKGHCPWEVVYYEEIATLEEARSREKYLKSGGGRNYLKRRLGR